MTLKNLLRAAFASAIVLPGMVKAQTVIDYGQWSTSACNAFSSSPTIGGIVHKSVLGQPRFINSSIALDYKFSGNQNYATTMRLKYNFVANHQYEITVSASNSYNTAESPNLRASLNNFGGESNTCNGPGVLGSGGTVTPSQEFTMNNSIFMDFTFHLNPGSTTRSNLDITGVPGGTAWAIPDQMQVVSIRKITIKDLTSAPPFPMQSSLNTRLCGNQDPIAFYVGNPSNATVTRYRFYIPANSWLYNGSPAPATIDVVPPTNFIVLTPMACTGATRVEASVLWQNIEVSAGLLNINVTTPDLTLYGPDRLVPGEAGYYDLQGTTSTPPNYGWPCTTSPLWSTDNAQSFLYNTTPSAFHKYLSTNFNILGSSGLSQTVNITASLSMCGVDKNITKSVIIYRPFSPFSETIRLNEEEPGISLNPNPTSGKFTLSLDNPDPAARLSIHSIDGRLIKSTSITGPHTALDLSGSPAGVYFVRITQGKNVVTRQLLKQ